MEFGDATVVRIIRAHESFRRIYIMLNYLLIISYNIDRHITYRHLMIDRIIELITIEISNDIVLSYIISIPIPTYMRLIYYTN